MKKLLIFFLIALAVISIQAQEKPKMNFMELFITEVDDSSQMRNPASGTDDFISNIGIVNVFDADITVPIKKTDAFGFNIWQLLEWVVNAEKEKTEAVGTFTAFTWIFQPQFVFDKYYKLNTGARVDAKVRFDFTGTKGLNAEKATISIFANNNITIPKIMEIWINLYGMWNYEPTYEYAPTSTSQTTIELIPAWSMGGPGMGDNWHFQGSIWQGMDQFWFHYVGPQYANGIGWCLAQEFHLNLQPKFWKDGDANKNETLLEKFVLSNYAIILWDIMKLTKVKDISLTLIAAEDLEITFPYCSGAEVSKDIKTEGLYGAEFGIKGFSFGLYAYLKTSDTYNASLGYNESAGNDLPYYSTAAGSRLHGTGQLGPSVKVQYFGNNLGFRLTYYGFANIRDYNDPNGQDWEKRETWANNIRADFFIFF